MTTKAKFISHRVEQDGLHIFGITGASLLPDVEIFIPRDEALAYDWIDSFDGITGAEELEVSDDVRDREREEEIRKLAEWNALANGRTSH